MSENEAHLKFNNVEQLATITKIEQDEKDVVFLYDISEFPFHLQKNVEIKIEYFGIEEKKFKSSKWDFKMYYSDLYLNNYKLEVHGTGGALENSTVYELD
jgi:hypothetical protein